MGGQTNLYLANSPWNFYTNSYYWIQVHPHELSNEQCSFIDHVTGWLVCCAKIRSPPFWVNPRATSTVWKVPTVGQDLSVPKPYTYMIIVIPKWNHVIIKWWICEIFGRPWYIHHDCRHDAGQDVPGRTTGLVLDLQLYKISKCMIWWQWQRPCWWCRLRTLSTRLTKQKHQSAWSDDESQLISASDCCGSRPWWWRWWWCCPPTVL